MDKRALGIGLTLLSLALWIGPIVAAFGAHNWSLRETVLPNEKEMENIQNKVENVMGDEDISTDLFYAEDYSGTDGSFSLGFSSPFDFSMEITDAPNFLTCDTHDVKIANLSMIGESVEVGPGENVKVLEVTITDQGDSHLRTAHESDLPNLGFSDGPFKFEVAGISVAFSFENASEEGSTTNVDESGGK